MNYKAYFNSGFHGNANIHIQVNINKSFILREHEFTVLSVVVIINIIILLFIQGSQTCIKWIPFWNALVSF
jgi:hypothetical protein